MDIRGAKQIDVFDDVPPFLAAPHFVRPGLGRHLEAMSLKGA